MGIGWRPKGWESAMSAGTLDVGAILIRSMFEAGADAMLEDLKRLARESPTGTFVIDSKTVNVYTETLSVGEVDTNRAPSTGHRLSTTCFNGNKRE